MPPPNPPMPPDQEPASPHDTAHYIHDCLKGLTEMATGPEFAFLRYLLGMASVEALTMAEAGRAAARTTKQDGD